MWHCAKSEMRPAANLRKARVSEHAGGGDGVDAITSGSNHGSEAGGREENGGRFGVMTEGEVGAKAEVTLNISIIPCSTNRKLPHQHFT